MADTNAMADIRGIDIDKLAKGFADELLIMQKLVTVTKTSAREIRWFKKTSGFLDSTDTTAITASQIANVDFKARPVVVEQSWTRNTSYVRKYFVESPTIADEDIRDTDIDILATNVRDLVRAVSNQVDVRIYNILTESQSVVDINTNASTAAWDAGSGQDPIEDILEGIQNIRTQGYNIFEGGVLLLSPKDHKSLLTWIITTKGASVPAFASTKLEQGAITNILGLSVIVSTFVVADSATIALPKVAVTWKEFVPITSVVISDPGIGKKIRVWQEGEAILTDPKAVNLITNTQA